MNKSTDDRKESRPHNTGFASGGALCEIEFLNNAYAFVTVDRTSSRLPPERKPRNR